MVIYFIKQRKSGKNKLIPDCYMEIVNLEEKSINDLNLEEIKQVMGLNGEEFTELLGHLTELKIDIHIFFQIYMENRRKKNGGISRDQVFYLANIKLIRLRQSKITQFFEVNTM